MMIDLIKKPFHDYLNSSLLFLIHLSSFYFHLTTFLITLNGELNEELIVELPSKAKDLLPPVFNTTSFTGFPILAPTPAIYCLHLDKLMVSLETQK